MKKILTFCFILLGFTAANAQAAKTTAANDKVLMKAQIMPQFAGDINKYLTDNIQYPADAKANNVEGTIYVNFVVGKDGSVSQVKIVRGLKGGISLEKEAVRVVSGMPKWTPGKQDGKTVSVSYMLPINFTLDGKATQVKQ